MSICGGRLHFLWATWAWSRNHVENAAGEYDGWQVGPLVWSRWCDAPSSPETEEK